MARARGRPGGGEEEDSHVRYIFRSMRRGSEEGGSENTSQKPQKRPARSTSNRPPFGARTRERTMKDARVRPFAARSLSLLPLNWTA
ncbi:UNVERIFIED_CONTAM: hypothetical protein K2H54_074908 [Gekko kuhli]